MTISNITKDNMVNTINTLTERNKELLNKIEELENLRKVEISREAQLKIIDKIQAWKKENYEVGDRLKKYEKNTYPSFIANSDWPVWKSLAGHVNFELNMVQYLHTKENPLDELLEMMLDSITRNVISSYNWQGHRDKELENIRKLKEEKQEAIEYKEAAIGLITDQRKRIAKETAEIKKLTKEKTQLLNHKKIVSEIVKEYYKPFENTPNWHEKVIEELEKGEKSNTIIDIIRYWKSEAEKWEEEAMIHLDAIGVSEIWNKRIASELREEIDNGLELIEESDEVIKAQQEQITKLNEFYLANKSLPKTPNKFKLLKEKTKTKFQQFQQLVKKAKVQTQEFIARIEVKTN